MTLIVGMASRAGCGKNTAVDFFVYNNETGKARHLAFGDGVKKATAAMFNIPIFNLYKNKEAVSERWGITYRTMMQKVGTEFARNIIDKDFWVTYLMPDMENLLRQEPDTIFITDVRFDNEAKWITNMGGVIIKIHRSGFLHLLGKEAEHESELGIDDSLVDYHISNEGSSHDLGQSLAKIINDIKCNTP